MSPSCILSRAKLPAFLWPAAPEPDRSCSDCRRARSCGLPPHRDCEERLGQAEITGRLGSAPPQPMALFDVRFWSFHSGTDAS